MIRVICLLLFSIFASNVCSQVYTYKVLGYTIYNLMNDNKWSEYTPEKDLLYVYNNLDNQEIRIYDTTTDTSNIYKCWEKAEPFIKDKEGSYSIKATEVIGDLVLHELIQFVFDDSSTHLYITFGNSITMWDLEFIEKKDSPANNIPKQANRKSTNKVLKKNPNFKLEE